MNAKNNTTLITVAVAADFLACTPGRIRQLLDSGKLEGYRIGEKLRIVENKSLQKYAKTRRKAGRPKNLSK